VEGVIDQGSRQAAQYALTHNVAVVGYHEWGLRDEERQIAKRVWMMRVDYVGA